jgi:excisionase family DNA binding protein
VTASSSGNLNWIENMKSTPSPLPRFLSIAALAARLSVSPKTVSRWIQTGQLRAHQLGRQVRISEEDAITFVATRRR